MKKNIIIFMLVSLSCVTFADIKSELGNIVENINSKEFEQADKRIHFLQNKGDKLSSQGKYDEAIKSFQEALEQADKLYGKNSSAAAACYTGIGMTYAKKGAKRKAADNLLKASEIFKKSMGGFIRPRASRFLLIQAGFLYYDLKLYRNACDALESAEKDIALFTPDEKEKHLPKFYRYLALALYKEKKYVKAIQYLKASQKLELQKTPVNNNELAVINLFWGNALLETGKPKESLRALLDSEKYFKLCKSSSFYQYNLYFSLSLVNEQLGNNNQKLIYAKKLNNICQNFDSQNFRKVVGLICLADALHANNQKKKAVKHMEQALELAHKQNQSPKSIARIQMHLQNIIDKE